MPYSVAGVCKNGAGLPGFPENKRLITYMLTSKTEAATVKTIYYPDVQLITLPIDVKAGLGL